MGRMPNRRGQDLRAMHSSFDPATAGYIDAEAKRHGVAKSVIISGLVKAGIKAIHMKEKDD